MSVIEMQLLVLTFLDENIQRPLRWHRSQSRRCSIGFCCYDSCKLIAAVDIKFLNGNLGPNAVINTIGDISPAGYEKIYYGHLSDDQAA